MEYLRSHLLDVSEEKDREIQTRKTTEIDLRSRIADFVNRMTELELELANERRISEKNVGNKMF